MCEADTYTAGYFIGIIEKGHKCKMNPPPGTKVNPKRLFVFESPVHQHYGRSVIPTHQKALIGCDGP